MSDPSDRREQARRAMGARLRELRLRAILSQDELARRVGVKHRATIARWETGSRGIPTAMIEPLAQALNTSPAVLLGEREPPPIPVRQLGAPATPSLLQVEQQVLDHIVAMLTQRPDLLPATLTAVDRLLQGADLTPAESMPEGIAATLQRLRQLDLGTLTPVQALVTLAELQEHVRAEDAVLPALQSDNPR
jgi:transcriptional regulator with XRE-family HTH domain